MEEESKEEKGDFKNDQAFFTLSNLNLKEIISIEEREQAYAEVQQPI